MNVNQASDLIWQGVWAVIVLTFAFYLIRSMFED